MASIFGSDKTTQTTTSDLWPQRAPFAEEIPKETPPGARDSRHSFLSHLEDNNRPSAQELPRKQDKSFRGKDQGSEKPTIPLKTEPQDRAVKKMAKLQTRTDPSEAPQKNATPLRQAKKAESNPTVNTPDRLQDSSAVNQRQVPVTPTRRAEQLPNAGKELPIQSSLPLRIDTSEVLREIRSPQESTLQSMLTADSSQSPVPMSVLNLSAMSPMESLTRLEMLSDQMLASLQALGFALGGRDAMMNESPLLALLSGHVEQVAPQSIPKLIASSPMMQGILGSGDSGALFQTPQPLQNLLQQLGLSNSPLAQALQKTDLLQAGTTLSDALKALGFDTASIEKAAGSLANTVKEGQLPDLMLRIAKWKAQQQADELGGSLAVASQMAQANPNRLNQPVQNSLEPGRTQVEGNSRLPPTKLEKEPASLGVFVMDPTQNILIPLETRGEAPISEGIQAFLNQDPSLAKEPISQSKSLRNESIQTEPLPQIALASRDPFASIATQWQANDIQSFIFDPSQQSLETALNSSDTSINSMESTDSTDTFTLESPQLATLYPIPENPESALAAKESFSNRSSTPDAILRTNLATLTATDSRSSGDSSSSEQGFSSPSKDDASSMLNTWSPKNDSKSAFSLQNEAPTQQLQPAQTAENLQKIFDRASMMVKEGGGSIRVDLGDQGLGTVDLALDIKDKTVELRIMTSSHQARELLSQELPRLRDSLLQQNLNLEKVEIGLGGGSAWSQSSSQGQSQGQSFQWAEQSSYRSPQGSRDARSYTQTSTTRQVGINPLHKGLIQVRV